MEQLADKICQEELGQEPSENNLAFRKTLVHGMVRWEQETKVKNFFNTPVMRSGCVHSYKAIYLGMGYVRQCTKCGDVQQ